MLSQTLPHLVHVRFRRSDPRHCCVCVSSARIFYFTGALPHVFDQPPIAAGAGPFDLRWGGGGLFVAAATLMKDAG